MTTGGQFDRDFLSLLWDVCDDTATPAQCAALGEWLEREPQARRFYLQYTALLSDLAEESIAIDQAEFSENSVALAGNAALNSGQALGLPGGNPPAAPGLLQYLRHDLTARLLLSGIVVVLLGYFATVLGLLAWQHGHLAAPVARTALSGHGTIVATQNCRWENTEFADGNRVSQRALRLGAGKTELLLDGGARILLEGPAALELQSDQSAFLQFGRLVAVVPAAAVGFAIETPTAHIVDLGTEFALAVERSGKTDVHVLRGKVEVALATSVDAPSAAVVVSVGQAVRIAALDRATIEPIPHDALGFEDLRRPLADIQAHSIAGAKSASADSTRPRQRHGVTDVRRNDLPAVEYFLLGNLFDDAKSTSLDAAQRSDTFRATAGANALGVNRVLYGGAPLAEIAPDCWFDFSNLGWQNVRYGEIANDAWAKSDTPGESPEGGIQTLGRKIGRFEPKLEEGIGMHANALMTFDLNEIRAASADGLSGAMYFVCDRCGLNDFVFGQAASVHMLVVTSGGGKVLSCWLDGAPVQSAAGERGTGIASPIGSPLTADGKFVSCRMLLPVDVRFLTLAVTSAGDGYTYDAGVWSGARLERAAAAARNPHQSARGEQ